MLGDTITAMFAGHMVGGPTKHAPWACPVAGPEPQANCTPEELLCGRAASISSFSTLAVFVLLPRQQRCSQAGQGPGHDLPGCSSTALSMPH